MVDLVTQLVPAISALGGAFLGLVGGLWTNSSRNKHERKLEAATAERELAQRRTDELFAIYSEFVAAAARVLTAQRAIVSASLYERESYSEVLPGLRTDVTTHTIAMTEAQAKILLKGSEAAKHGSAAVVDLVATMTPYRRSEPMDAVDAGRAATASKEATDKLGEFLEACSKEFQDPS